jgi:hypothetical protein
MNPPRFDPTNPQHRTAAQWRAAGPSDRWYISCVAAALAHGEAVALLPSAVIVRFSLTADGLVEVEVCDAD